MPPANAPAADDVFGTDDALLEEYAAIVCDDWVNDAPQRRTLQWLHEHAAELCAAPKTALCLSGGGIRSASFCLGALQALARKNLLGEFTYLSTVSGGGYIGAWLDTIMHGGGEGNGALNAANKALTEATDVALRALRNYTNFLIPEGGFASSDAWSAIVLWLRNVLLNWLVFGPIMLAAAMVPLFYRELLWAVTPGWGGIALLLGLACLLVAMIMVGRSVPTHAYDRTANRPDGRYGASPVVIQSLIVAPILAWGFFAPLWFSAISSDLHERVPFLSWTFVPLSFGAFAMMIIGYVIACFTLNRIHWASFFWNFGFWAAGSALTGVLLHLGATLGQQMTVTTLAVLAPLWIVGAQVLHSTLYVGLRWTAAYAELDREWLARLNGEKLVPAMLWSAIAAITLILPRLVFDQWPTTYAAILGFATGPVGAWLARSAQSFSTQSAAQKQGSAWLASIVREAAITLATLLFIATLFVLFGRLGATIVDGIQTILAWSFWQENAWLRAAVVIIILVLLSLGFGRRININRFSLHGVYRNRLARAFIGTGRPPERREPDAYTRFDPADNLRMQDLYQGSQRRGFLFPVVNVTLNLLDGAPSGWAERKAAPFTITPLRAGAACLGKTRLGEDAPGKFVRTEFYAGDEHDQGPEDQERGITLGTAMTISGAAVSPNMGYHSSPATAFLMTLFNVRLGAWLPNPAVSKRLAPAMPDNALWPLFNEMFGRANDKRSNVYLSDGGHFENLGLYEMLRRECCRIVVIDADCDPDYHYADLGRALRLAYIDLDVTVEFIAPIVKDAATLNPAGALARIKYHSGKTGLLLYLKSWLPKNVRADVVAYGAEHEDFPNESTTDQFFTESQFESYRVLGEQIVGEAFAAADAFDADKLRQVFVRAELATRRSQPMPPGWQGPPPHRE